VDLLNNLKDWFKQWLLKLNINKFNVVSYCRNVINTHQYSVDNTDLELVQHIKDLGVIFYFKLNFSLHMSDKVNNLKLIQYLLVLSKETSVIYLKNVSLCYIKHWFVHI